MGISSPLSRRACEERLCGKRFQDGPAGAFARPSLRPAAQPKNARIEAMTWSTWTSVSSGYIGKGWIRLDTDSVTG